MPRLFADRVT